MLANGRTRVLYEGRSVVLPGGQGLCVRAICSRCSRAFFKRRFSHAHKVVDQEYPRCLSTFSGGVGDHDRRLFGVFVVGGVLFSRCYR